MITFYCINHPNEPSNEPSRALFSIELLFLLTILPSFFYFTVTFQFINKSSFYNKKKNVLIFNF